MKSFALGFGILLAAFSFAARAEAQNYPWCAAYSMTMGEGRNCGFASFEQCMATVRGAGGFCERNSQYVAPADIPGGRARRKAQHPS